MPSGSTTAGKVKAYVAAIERNDEAYHHDHGYDGVVEFLFPELHWREECERSAVPGVQEQAVCYAVEDEDG